METIKVNNGKDPELWEIAQKRVSFRSHLTVYIIMNLFFWLLWLFSGQEYNEGFNLPWPVWPMVGWGIGVFFHYMGAYVYPKNNSVEREYQKLKTNKILNK
ncbi:MAG TPA: 2TM domain-containing protein [Chitinophagaceae bacterium]|nr:2TM domain-containing protein [Chitinophagaceae bacterium]